MTKVHYLYSPIVKLVLKTKTQKLTFEYNQNTGQNWNIQFSVPFSDSGTAQTCTITIMNLSASHRKLFKKGEKVTLSAGYYEDGIGILSEGNITHISPYTSDGTNNTFSFTYKEGSEYAKSKAVKKSISASFAKGAKLKTIINRVASKGKVPLEKVDLKNNKAYKKGYTAKGKPLTVLKSLAKAGGSELFLRRGKYYIIQMGKANGYDEHILLTTKVKGQHGGTGLIQYPTINEDDNTAEIVSLLRYQVSTGSVVQVDDRFLKGTYRVKSGEHAFDGSAFTTTMEVAIK